MTYVLLSLADFSDFNSLLSGTHPLWFIVALVTFVFSLGVRGLRLSTMYSDEPRFYWHLRTVSVASVMNFLLPARLGEFSIVALVSRRLELGLGEVAMSIFAIRVQELVCTLILGLSLLLFGGGGEVKSLLGSVRPGATLGLLIGSCVLIALGAALFTFRQHRILVRSVAHMRDWRTWGYSAMVAILMFALIFSVAEWLNIANALAITPLIFLAALLVSFLPVNGIANVGGYHLAWALPLTLMGYASERAVSLSILAHLGVSALVLAAAAIVLGLDLAELGRTGQPSNPQRKPESGRP